MVLSKRASTVLNLLVNEYVQTATPVASEDIARKPALKVSPATVRSTMSQLTEEGYISRPHISAGGVPSDRGYRHHVESLPEAPSLPIRLRQQIDHALLATEADVESWTIRCANLLSRLTANLAIVTEPRGPSPRLKRIQLVVLQEFTALLVLVLDEARLLKRLLPLESPADQPRLDLAALRLNESLAGLDRAQMQARQLEMDALEERVKQDSMDLMGESERDATPAHHVEGLGRLLSQPEFAAGERARELVRMVEERVLLERAVSAAGLADPVVYIGAENREESLLHLGVIICNYGEPDGVGGTVCVVGPKRMSYGTAIAGARHLASFMDQRVSGLKN